MQSNELLNQVRHIFTTGLQRSIRTTVSRFELRTFVDRESVEPVLHAGLFPAMRSVVAIIFGTLSKITA
jgi:hypothetical protein